MESRRIFAQSPWALGPELPLMSDEVRIYAFIQLSQRYGLSSVAMPWSSFQLCLDGVIVDAVWLPPQTQTQSQHHLPVPDRRFTLFLYCLFWRRFVGCPTCQAQFLGISGGKNVSASTADVHQINFLSTLPPSSRIISI